MITEYAANTTTAFISSTYASDIQMNKANTSSDEPPGLRYSIPQTVVLAIIASVLSILTVIFVFFYVSLALRHHHQPE